MNYSVIEHLKNGRIFSSKYESKIMKFACPYIIIYANFMPNKEKLSEDRWDIREISRGVLVPILSLREALSMPIPTNLRNGLM